MTTYAYDPNGFRCTSCRQKRRLYFLCKRCGGRFCSECGLDEDGRQTVLCRKCREKEKKY